MAEQQATFEPRRITPDELKRLLDAKADVLVLDVRTDAAYHAGDVKIPGALRLSPDDISPAANLPRDRLVVTYCT